MTTQQSRDLLKLKEALAAPGQPGTRIRKALRALQDMNDMWRATPKWDDQELYGSLMCIIYNMSRSHRKAHLTQDQRLERVESALREAMKELA